MISNIAFLVSTHAWAEIQKYTIADAFNGCEFGKLYEIDGGGVLECEEYNYFYEYRPRVIASGSEVIMIGNEKISGNLYNESVYHTNVRDDFDGCDFNKTYHLDDGLLFQCSIYKYHYAYHPKVQIFVIEGRAPKVFIDDEEYGGILFKPK